MVRVAMRGCRDPLGGMAPGLRREYQFSEMTDLAERIILPYCADSSVIRTSQ